MQHAVIKLVTQDVLFVDLRVEELNDDVIDEVAKLLFSNEDDRKLPYLVTIISDSAYDNLHLSQDTLFIFDTLEDPYFILNIKGSVVIGTAELMSNSGSQILFITEQKTKAIENPDLNTWTRFPYEFEKPVLPSFLA